MEATNAYSAPILKHRERLPATHLAHQSPGKAESPHADSEQTLKTLGSLHHHHNGVPFGGTEVSNKAYHSPGR